MIPSAIRKGISYLKTPQSFSSKNSTQKILNNNSNNNSSLNLNSNSNKTSNNSNNNKNKTNNSKIYTDNIKNNIFARDVLPKCAHGDRPRRRGARCGHAALRLK